MGPVWTRRASGVLGYGPGAFDNCAGRLSRSRYEVIPSFFHSIPYAKFT